MGCTTTKFILAILVFFGFFEGIGQYTEVINSSRPGNSVSAYAVGTNVIQVEGGLLFEQQDQLALNTDSNILGAEFSIRYGFLFETLEINWEGAILNQNIQFNTIGTSETRTDFGRNRIGLKYLVFDPFKDPERNKPNLYSWKANHGFKWKNLVPAVSIYGGATFNLGENPFFVGDPMISYRALVSTQSQLSPKLVLTTNWIYDRITSDVPELSYVISLSHALRNPKWSVLIEHQGIDSDRYSDALLRVGAAHLFSKTFQADLVLGSNFKTTPSRVFTSLGFSYRWDNHQDKLLKNKDPNESDKPKIKKKKLKKKKRKKGDKIDF